MDETEYFNRRVGTTLRGKWTLESLLGVGGMAAVYVGVHHIGRREAIKILHPEVAANPEVRARFEQEAHAVNRLQHPGAVQVRDFDVTEDGCPFLVMELLEGESLSTLLERGPVALPELLRWTDELLEVLAAAHDLGIIHRDIKPDNLFIQKDGRLKVLDFGIARMREGAPKAMNTRTGTALGTLSYMPPEQARGIHIDGRADLYSVGATLFRALARRRIHDGQSDADVLIKVATTPAPRLASVAPEVAATVCSVVDCALSFEREHRYPDARTMQADVRALARNEIPPFVAAHPLPARAESVPLSFGGLVSSGVGSEDRTRAEGSTPQRAQGLSRQNTEPAPTRIDRISAPISAPAPLATPLAVAPAASAHYPANAPSSPISAPAPTLVAPPVSVPPSPRRPSSHVVVIAIAAAVLFGLGLLVLLTLVGGFWLTHASADQQPPAAVSASSEASGEATTPEAVATDTSASLPATATTPATVAATAPPVAPGTTTVPLALPPVIKTTAPPVPTAPGTTLPFPATPPATTPPAVPWPTPPATTPGKPPHQDKKKKHEK